MNAAQSQGALAGLVGTAAAVGDLRLMWQELAQVAPDEIQADAESVRDAWAKQEDNAATGNLQSALTIAVLYSGSMGRVDAFARQNCDAGSAASTGAPLTGSGVLLVDASGGAVQLSIVDVDSGTVTGGPHFAGNGTAVPNLSYVQMNSGASLTYRALFSPDFEHMVATAPGSAGDPVTSHVGWLDQGGTFTDVSALTPRGEFSSTEGHDTPAFDVNGSLWFARRADDNAWKTVPQMMRYAPRAASPQPVGKPA